MSNNYILPLLLAAGALLAGCDSPSSKKDTATEESADKMADNAGQAEGLEAASALPGIQPVDMPNPGIPGYTFPQDSATINQWVSAGNAAAINLHGWGIWTALSSATSQLYNGDTLHVFETWHTKAEVDSLSNLHTAAKGKNLLARRPAEPKRQLNRPRQFFRDPQLTSKLQKKVNLGAHLMVADDEEEVFESVSYDPTAARTIIDGKLFHASTLQGMLNNQQAAIPDFPNTAIAIKPVYEIVPGPRHSTGLYKMKVWSGSPKLPQPYGQGKWPSCVYVDIKNGGQGNGQVSQGCGSATPATTYNLNDFIHYTLTAAEAKALGGGEAGDYAILVAMHITSKEIKRWTWQTMWWAPNPDRAPDPSSPAVVAARPAQLKGPSRHYAMAISYQMIHPVQPLVGGNNKGKSIYVFNPYLEAPFSSSTFSEPARVVTNGIVVVNNVGIRTNCMSCHAQASFTPLRSKIQNPGYIADTYVDMGSPKFKGNLRTDFLWSISDMATFTADSAR